MMSYTNETYRDTVPAWDKITSSDQPASHLFYYDSYIRLDLWYLSFLKAFKIVTAVIFETEASSKNNIIKII